MTRIITAITDGPPTLEALHTLAAGGGECVFIGRTRPETHAAFGDLLRLEYELYEPMVEKLLDQLARNAAAKFGCTAVRIAHARGPVAIGEASVVIQTLTPHRAEAFAAARYLIDRLKKELPIWKHEIWQRGRTHVEGRRVDMDDANDHEHR